MNPQNQTPKKHPAVEYAEATDAAIKCAHEFLRAQEAGKPPPRFKLARLETLRQEAAKKIGN